MILVITAIIFILMILGCAIDEDIGTFFLMLFILCIIVISVLVSATANARTIDSRINMYTEENENIESKVKETVRAYMDFEEDTYTELIEDADLTTLIIKYPELNSNELVKSEIDLYIENSNKIKELKEKKIDITVKKWWLYFGK